MRGQRYTIEQVTKALVQSKGLVYLAAKRLRCEPETIRNYCKRYPAVQATREALRGEMVDLAEQKLWESIQRGEAWGITLCLKTLGRDRGYVERQEHSGSQDAPMLLKVVYEDAIDVTPSPPKLLEAPDDPGSNGTGH
jgi:hypothetical protein